MILGIFPLSSISQSSAVANHVWIYIVDDYTNNNSPYMKRSVLIPLSLPRTFSFAGFGVTVSIFTFITLESEVEELIIYFHKLDDLIFN